VSCREMLPDPGVYAACMREAFAELVAAADALHAGAAEGAAVRAGRKTIQKTAMKQKAAIKKRKSIEKATTVRKTGQRSGRRRLGSKVAG
jgi:hypothetical protein